MKAERPALVRDPHRPVPMVRTIRLHQLPHLRPPLPPRPVRALPPREVVDACVP